MISPVPATIATRWIAGDIAEAVAREILNEGRARPAAAKKILPQGLEASSDGFHAWLALLDNSSRGELVATLRRVGVGVVASDAFALRRAPEAVRLGPGVPETVLELETSLEIIADLLSQAPSVSSLVV